MTHPYADDAVEMMQQVAQLDFAALPSLRFVSELRQRIIDRAFSVADAETIVSRIDVSLPPESMTNDQVDSMAESFAIAVEKMHDALLDAGFHHPVQCVAQMASKFSVKLS